MKDKLLALAAENHHLIGLSINDAVVATGVGRDQIYNAIRDGRLPAKKWGRRTIILRGDLETFLKDLPNLRRLAP